MDLLRKNDFELFSLPPKFALNLADLSAAFHKLQLLAHPDRYASGTDAEKRISLQLTTRVNEAYQRLKMPLSRAAYLCELHGKAVDAETNTAMPSAFLIEQMQWRETLEEEGADLPNLLVQVSVKKTQLMLSLERHLDQDQNFSLAAADVRQLMFVDKFLQSLSSAMQ
jgi:molecular chaperone HscB